MWDLFVPLSWYFFFVNPFMWKWQFSMALLYSANLLAWLPHVLYMKNLDKKMYQMHLLRGGKYVKLSSQTVVGDIFVSWASICDFHLLTEDYMSFADKDTTEFLTKEGQMAYETQVQLEYYMDQTITVNDQIIYFMKEGKVHYPEVFEMVLRGYNIDTTDFSINTAHNFRHREPNRNMFAIN